MYHVPYHNPVTTDFITTYVGTSVVWVLSYKDYMVSTYFVPAYAVGNGYNTFTTADFRASNVVISDCHAEISGLG